MIERRAVGELRRIALRSKAHSQQCHGERLCNQANPTGLKLKALLADGQIKRDKAKSEKIKLYGDGERTAINLALEKKLLLLIDDWRPYQAAIESGIETVNSLVYLVRLYDQDRISAERVLDAMAKMTRRGTLKAEWILEALRIVASIQERKPIIRRAR